jgi:murein tripeptide amidase MpaA
MTATLTAPVEALLREQVAKGYFPSLDLALEVAVKTVDGRRASHALESGHQPAESVKEVPVATSMPAKRRKKPRSDEDAGQMSLCWVSVNLLANFDRSIHACVDQ